MRIVSGDTLAAAADGTGGSGVDDDAGVGETLVLERPAPPAAAAAPEPCEPCEPCNVS
jgi:hypothetical protein